MWPAYHSTSPIGDIEDHPGGIELSDADGDDDDRHAAAGSRIIYAIRQPMGGTKRHFCARSEDRKLQPFGVWDDHPGGTELSDAECDDDDDLHTVAGSSIISAIPQPMGGKKRHFCARSEGRTLPSSVSSREP